jgi:tetratricopeptide (TPR) repeat protein
VDLYTSFLLNSRDDQEILKHAKLLRDSDPLAAILSFDILRSRGLVSNMSHSELLPDEVAYLQQNLENDERLAVYDIPLRTLCRATSALILGKYHECLDILHNAKLLDLETPYLLCLNTAAVAYKALLYPSDALSCLNAVIAGCNGEAYPFLLSNRASVFIDLQEWKDAFFDCDSAIRQSGDMCHDAMLFYHRSMVLEHFGEFAAALEDATAAIRFNPGLKFAYYRRAKIHEKLRNFELALNDLLSATQIDDKFSEAWNNAGRIFRTQGRLSDAIEYYGRAIDASPSLAPAWSNRAIAHGLLHRFEDAVYDISHAISLEPFCSDWWYHRALILAELHSQLSGQVYGFHDVPSLDAELQHALSNMQSIVYRAIWDSTKAIELTCLNFSAGEPDAPLRNLLYFRASLFDACRLQLDADNDRSMASHIYNRSFAMNTSPSDVPHQCLHSQEAHARPFNMERARLRRLSTHAPPNPTVDITLVQSRSADVATRQSPLADHIARMEDAEFKQRASESLLSDREMSTKSSQRIPELPPLDIHGREMRKPLQLPVPRMIVSPVSAPTTPSIVLGPSKLWSISKESTLSNLMYGAPTVAVPQQEEVVDMIRRITDDARDLNAKLPSTWSPTYEI